jgi:CubicO group peptidase (beta-lactamase class C family)
MFRALILALIVFLGIGQCAAASLDNSIKTAMRLYHVPVVGYAIINDNKIVAVRTISIDPKIKANKNSLFQAASISKSVSAYGFLKLANQHHIAMNTPANKLLSTWKIPVNKFNRHDPVTMQKILDMTSGLSVSGFPGYRQGLPLPTLKEILDGKPPANSKPIRVFYSPGDHYFYSGGSYQVLQQIIVDLSKQPFSEYMSKAVLLPIGMNHSYYQYPLSKQLRKQAIPGFWANGKVLHGGWNNYAIGASGGLWSTPTDLAKFALNVTDSYMGRNGGLISQKLAKKMLTRGKHSDFGLGVIVSGKGRSLNFRKNGHNYGYHNEMLMFPNTGQGIVMMSDSENGMDVLNYAIPLIAHKYHMPYYFPYFDELISIPDDY